MSVLPASTPLSPAALTPQKTLASTLSPHAVSRLRQARLARSTRPFLARGGPKGERCEGCRLRPSHCMCALRPELATRAAFCLLMHDAEPLKPSNTGWLIADVVKDTHDFGWSRSRVDPALVTEAERRQHPPVRQALVLEENPHGPALYLGAHARSIEGTSEAESRALIDRLMELATQPGFTYTHKWRPHDLVMWDNRAVLHRATPFATTTERRHMVRTCVAGTAPTLAAAA